MTAPITSKPEWAESLSIEEFLMEFDQEEAIEITGQKYAPICGWEPATIGKLPPKIHLCFDQERKLYRIQGGKVQALTMAASLLLAAEMADQGGYSNNTLTREWLLQAAIAMQSVEGGAR